MSKSNGSNGEVKNKDAFKRSTQAHEIEFEPGDRLVYQSGEVVSVLDVLPNQQMRVIDRKNGEIMKKPLDQGIVRSWIKKGRILHVKNYDEDAYNEGKGEDDFPNG